MIEIIIDKNSLVYKLKQQGYQSNNGYYWFKDYQGELIQQIIVLKRPSLLDESELESYAVELGTDNLVLPDMMKDIQIAMNRAESDFKELKRFENESKRIQSKI